MGREVRRVPPDWKHPKNKSGYIALLGSDYEDELQNWELHKSKWDEGLREDFTKDHPAWKPRDEDELKMTFEGWNGKRPERSDYMPSWSESEKTHYQMYETCSEGTPISPVMKTPEELARWLADNNASAFGPMTATYEEWLCTIRRGFAPSMVCSPGKGIQSGVEACRINKE